MFTAGIPVSDSWHRALLVAFMGMGAAIHGAQAQTTYTAEEVKLPTTAKWCNTSSALLSATGQVAANCGFTIKIDALTAFFSAIANGELAYASARTGEVSRIALWRSGGTLQTLTSGTAYGAAYGESFLPTGEVFGYASSNVTSPSANATFSTWKGTVRSKWSPPAALATGGWRPTVYSPSGQAILLTKGYGPVKFATVINKVATLLPDQPAECANASINPGEAVINDTGQVALLKNQYVNTIPNALTTQGQVCLWFDGAWKRLPVVPAVDERVDPATLVSGSDHISTSDHRLVGLSKDGKVLALDGSPHRLPRIWTEGAQWQYVDPRVSGMAANGDLLGGVSIESPIYKPGTAITVHEGVVNDLNQAVAAPSGLVWRQALRTNAKGQILVTAGPLDASSTPTFPLNLQERLFVLTPH
jgi:hypothetical protein